MKKIAFSADIVINKSYAGSYRTNYFLVMMDLEGNMYGWSTQNCYWVDHLDIAEAFVRSEKLMPSGKTFYEVERCKQVAPKTVSFS